jgi:hypothetical protein
MSKIPRIGDEIWLFVIKCGLPVASSLSGDTGGRSNKRDDGVLAALRRAATTISRITTLIREEPEM